MQEILYKDNTWIQITSNGISLVTPGSTPRLLRSEDIEDTLTNHVYILHKAVIPTPIPETTHKVHIGECAGNTWVYIPTLHSLVVTCVRTGITHYLDVVKSISTFLSYSILR